MAVLGPVVSQVVRPHLPERRFAEAERRGVQLVLPTDVVVARMAPGLQIRSRSRNSSCLMSTARGYSFRRRWPSTPLSATTGRLRPQGTRRCVPGTALLASTASTTDPVVNQCSAARSMLAATHSHRMETVYARIPGLIVVSPSTPAEAKGLLKASIRCDDPVIFLESEKMLNDKGEVPDDPGLPESFNVLVRELQSLCLDVELLKE